MYFRLLLAAAAIFALVGCGETRNGAYYQDDRPPSHHVDVSALADAVPKVEKVTRAGNKNPYTVLGSTYHLLSSNVGYQDTGVASWYGTKFHGNHTANGETYDMYAMSAAHKTLPIPCYVKVKNLDNGRSVIVRVNDRGPFLHGRIIDLSYAAAKKLGYADKGTANVQVTAIDPHEYQRTDDVSQLVIESKPSAAVISYLQVGAYTSPNTANALQQRLQDKLLSQVPVVVRGKRDGNQQVYKVMVGPLADAVEILKWRTWFQSNENLIPFLVHD
jgi:rare lipoprotein A